MVDISHYAKKIVDGARALDDLFKHALSSTSSSFDKNYYQTLITSYSLTDNQQRKIALVNKKLINAMKVIGYVKSRYGCDEHNVIKNNEQLFRDVYHIPLREHFTNAPTADALSFGIAFHVSDGYFREGVLGEAQMTVCNIENIDDQIISDQKFHLFGGLKSLSLRIKDTPDNENHRVKRHEIKHLIDSFIMSSDYFPRELSADMYSALMGFTPFRRDIKECTSDILGLSMAFSSCNYKNKTAIESCQLILDERTKYMDSMENFPLKKLYHVQDAVGDAVCSYIIATTPLRKLEHRFDLVEKYALH